jgi:anti-sigma-K factor RskA
VAEAVLQNSRLKEAIMKLRDLSVSEKQEAELKIKTLQRQAALVPTLEERVLKLETELLVSEERLEELKVAHNKPHNLLVESVTNAHSLALSLSLFVSVSASVSVVVMIIGTT